MVKKENEENKIKIKNAMGFFLQGRSVHPLWLC